MKICVVAYKFGTEQEIGEHLGTYHYFIEKMRRLVKMGHEITVVCPNISWKKKGTTDVSGIRVVRYWPPLIGTKLMFPVQRFLCWLYVRNTQKQVLKTIQGKNFDFVYVWQARETGYAVAEIKDKLGIPFLFRQITAWHWHFERNAKKVFGNRQWYKILEKAGLSRIVDILLDALLDVKTQCYYAQTIYKRADKIIFLSRAAIRDAEPLGLDARKADDLGVAIEENMFYPMEDKEGIRKALGLPQDKIILFIGRIHFEEKGIGVLLDAVKEVVQTIPRARCIIIGGGGESERMIKKIAELHLEHTVLPVGKKTFVELPQYINASDVMVVPSLWMEAFGQVTIEGMSCGIPVVTSDAGASPEININGETGMVVPAGNVNKLADALIRLLEDEALRKRMGQQARKRVLEHYTYEALINRFLNIVHETLNV